MEISGLRMAAHQLAHPRSGSASELVGWFGAIQAQDPVAVQWAVGARLGGEVEQVVVQRALITGELVRTHALRGTWHLLAASDVRWVLELVAPRLMAQNTRRYAQLGLDAAVLARADEVLVRTLEARSPQGRPELGAALREAGISTAGQRLPWLIQHAELSGLICSGPAQGRDVTWALLGERAPQAASLPSREEAIAMLARRYLQSHGPAAVEDFGWWSGLVIADCRAAFEALRASCITETVEGRVLWRLEEHQAAPPSSRVHLLPAFDEYFVAYRHREDVVKAADAARINHGGGIIAPLVVVEGRIEGIWQRAPKRDRVVLEVELFDAGGFRHHEGLEVAAGRYGAFLGVDVEVTFV